MRRKISKIAILDTILSGWLMFLVIMYGTPAVMAITNYPPGSLLQPNDVTSSHIRDGAIVDADVNTSAGIKSQKITDGSTQGLIYISNGSKIATSSNFKISTSTPDLYVLGGRIHATSTNFNSVNYTWPSADGSANTALTTDGAGTLTWVSPASTKLSVSLTTEEALTEGQAVVMATGSQRFRIFDPSAGAGNTATAWKESSGNQQNAQSFTPTVNTTISGLSVIMYKQGTPTANTTITLEGDSAGVPDGVPFFSTTFADSSLSTAFLTYTYNVATTTLTAGTKYWLKFTRDGAVDASNYPAVTMSSPGSRTGGGHFLYNGTTWSEQANTHIDFRLLVWSTPGRVLKSAATIDDHTNGFIGFSNGTTATGSTATINVSGIQTGFSGLTIGGNYYLGNATSSISLTPGTFIKKVCKALSATSCLITNNW